MSSRRTGSRGARHVVDCDLELRPLMNVFIVLIPMLLMSAVFMEIRVIEMSQASGGAAAASATPAPKPLELSLRIRSDSYVVMGNGLEPMALPRSRADQRGVLDPTTTARLTEALSRIAAARPDNHEIRIVAEAGTRYQELVSLMDLARAAGLSDAALEGAMEGA